MKLLKNTELPFELSGIYVSKKFKKLCNFYNIKDAKFHDLRRQALTNFMKYKNLTVAETMFISGHRDPYMLLKIYNNLKERILLDKINNLKSMYNL